MRMTMRSFVCSVFLWCVVTQSAVADQIRTSGTLTDLSGLTVRLDGTRLFGSNRVFAGAVAHVIAYFDTDQRAFVWIPGQREVREGTWSLWDSTNFDRNYPLPQAFEAAAGVRVRKIDGRNFDLNITRSVLQVTAAEVMEGDVLNLSDGRAPCRMCQGGVTLSRLARH